MSENALRDLNTIPGSERRNESSNKASIAKHVVSNTNGNLEEGQTKHSVNGVEVVNTGAEVGISEVEYIESENLNDLEDVDSSLKTLLSGLDSKDWVLVCEALNNVRRLALFHRESVLDVLGDVISLVAKSLKNPRSAVCKTACMTSADIFSAYNDLIIESLDPLLVQLLLKSSQDKRFVCEAAEKALVSMTTWVSPLLLLPKLQPYLKNRNPRIRAKASMCFCRSVPRLKIHWVLLDRKAVLPRAWDDIGVEGIKAYGIDKLIQTAASQLSDQLPESREAARGLLLELQTVYQKFDDLSSMAVSEHPEMGSWEKFCQSKLSPLSAQAVLRVTNISREGLVIGS
ncbi:Coatomer beta subunit [Parasponia andersonii]|uniref:Coatomer beta subunit n=1 Tax=Parasponia andersonii TaxID=3476 RepID=A0A2P5A9R8_PARAD|nr:Coatomer beta subunit [Parasponia andersonii]